MQRFRTATPMGDWRSFKFTHAEEGVTYTEGQLYRINETVGMLFLDIQRNATTGAKEAKTIVEDDEGVLVYGCEKIMVDKVTGTGSAFVPGDGVYWADVQGGSVKNAWAATNYKIGICVKAADDDATEVMIDLEGINSTIAVD